MKQVLIICLAMLLLMSVTGCAALEQALEYTEPTEAVTEPEVTTEPEPTEETLPPFEECRVLSYYFQEPIPHYYYQRLGEIEVLERTNIHVRIYDLPCYRGDDVRNLAPGDLLILGDREIRIETIESNYDYFEEDSYIINGGEGVDGVWLRPFTCYNTETKRTEIDYTPCNSMGWSHHILTDEMDVRLNNNMYLHNAMAETFEMTPEAFVQDLAAYSDKLYLYNIILDMVDGKLEGVIISGSIDSQTDLSMIPKGLKPIDPDRLNSLMTGE